MERGNVNERIEDEASNMAAEAEVEQPVHGNIEPDPEQLTDMQKMARAMTLMAEQQARFMAHVEEQRTRQLEAQALARAEEVIHWEERSTSHEKFIKMNPPSFEGAVDPAEAEEWVKEIELIFGVMTMLENQ